MIDNKHKFNRIISLWFIAILIMCGTIGTAMAINTYSNDDNVLLIEAFDDSKNASGIKLIQEQKYGNENAVSYTNSKDLLPLVLTTANPSVGEIVGNVNFVERMVAVENKDDNEAYVRVLVAIPSTLDIEYDGVKAVNVLFSGSDTRNDAGWGAAKLVGTDVDCGGTVSNIYSVVYGSVENGEFKPTALSGKSRTDGYAMLGVYLHSDVGCKNGRYTFKGMQLDYDIDEDLKIKIKAEGSAVAFAADEIITEDPWESVTRGGESQ